MQCSAVGGMGWRLFRLGLSVASGLEHPTTQPSLGQLCTPPMCALWALIGLSVGIRISFGLSISRRVRSDLATNGRPLAVELFRPALGVVLDCGSGEGWVILEYLMEPVGLHELHYTLEVGLG